MLTNESSVAKDFFLLQIDIRHLKETELIASTTIQLHHYLFQMWQGSYTRRINGSVLYPVLSSYLSVNHVLWDSV